LGWNGHRLALANFLWSKNPKFLSDWRCDLAEVMLGVFGSEDANIKTVRSRTSKLKKFLNKRDFKIVISVSCRKDSPGYVRVIINENWQPDEIVSS